MKTTKAESINKYLRLVIQIIFFVLFPSVYSSCFAGMKYIFSQIGSGMPVALNSLVAVLLTVCIYTVIFGRFFCGFACAFGSLGDWLYGIHQVISRKLGNKPRRIPDGIIENLSMVKYFISAVILILCALGVYDSLHGSSPWDVFSKIVALKPELKGYWIGVILLMIIMAGMFFRERFFCKVLCPMGAIFALLPQLFVFTLHRSVDKCLKGCIACTRKCPMSVRLPDTRSLCVSGDCIQCRKCIETCPRNNIKCGFSYFTGNEIWFVLFRAALLALLFIWLGI